MTVVISLLACFKGGLYRLYMALLQLRRHRIRTCVFPNEKQ